MRGQVTTISMALSGEDEFLQNNHGLKKKIKNKMASYVPLSLLEMPIFSYSETYYSKSRNRYIGD